MPILLGLLAGKVLVYWAALGWISTWERPAGPKRARRSLIAASVRLLLGLLFGIPLVLFIGLPNKTALTLAFSAARLVSWLAVTRLAFPRVGWGRAWLFSLGATLVNWGLDFLIWQGHWADTRFGLC